MIVPPCRIGMKCHYFRMSIDDDEEYCFYPYLDPSDDIRESNLLEGKCPLVIGGSPLEKLLSVDSVSALLKCDRAYLESPENISCNTIDESNHKNEK